MADVVGTATYVPEDEYTDYFANRAGIGVIATDSRGVTQVTGAVGLVYGGVGAAIAARPVAAAVGRWGLQRLAMGLLNLINRIYQAQNEIFGDAAGAVRNEVATGEYINGGHAIKASERITALTRLINSGELSGSDRMIAGHIISDLKNALGR